MNLKIIDLLDLLYIDIYWVSGLQCAVTWILTTFVTIDNSKKTELGKHGNEKMAVILCGNELISDCNSSGFK
jgi:hypothetical protein